MDLNDCVLAVIEKWPRAERYAHNAKQLLVDGMVMECGIMPSGDDLWSSGNHTFSIKGNYCNCLEKAPIIAPGGKLCSHRLAAMFVVKIRKVASRTISRVFASAPDACEFITLQVEVLFADSGRKYRIKGHRHVDHGCWIRYDYSEIIQIDNAEFLKDSNMHGWIVTSATRSGALDFNYHLARMKPGQKDIVGLNRMSADDIDLKAQRSAMTAIDRQLQYGVNYAG